MKARLRQSTFDAWRCGDGGARGIFSFVNMGDLFAVARSLRGVLRSGTVRFLSVKLTASEILIHESSQIHSIAQQLAHAFF